MAGGGSGVVVVAGEALVDLVPAAEGTLAAHPGGGPYNAARTLGLLERPVAFLGRLSSDRFGRLLRRQLADDGVALDAVVATDDPTTLAMVDVDAAGAASYGFYTAGTSAPGLTVAAATAALPARPAMLHVGTLGLVFEPTAEAVEALVAGADDDVLVAVDPNPRPSAIRDPERYRARLGRLLARADVVKVSDDDLRWLRPDVDPVEGARAVLDAGPPVVLLTRGGDGAAVVTADGVTEVAAPPTRVVDTIGAGDAFGGGFLAWWGRAGLGRRDLAEREAVVAATRFACLVAARTCERPGASPPRLAEVEAAL